MRLSALLLAAIAAATSLPFLSPHALAADPAGLLPRYEAEARAADPAFAGFSAERGKAIYFHEENRDGKPMSCTSCHTSDPTAAGKTPAFRSIKPLAPSASPQRFTDATKVEKWLKRNCNDVYARQCTAQEKGDFVSWIIQQ